MNKATRIEVLGNVDKGIYRIGCIVLTVEGDVYFSPMQKNSDFHFSRHKDGTTHVKSTNPKIKQPLERRPPLREMKKFETGPTFGMNPKAVGNIWLWREYRGEKADGFFMVDLRIYDDSFPNFNAAWVNPRYFSEWVDVMKQGKYAKNCQIYAYLETMPWLCLCVRGITEIPHHDV